MRVGDLEPHRAQQIVDEVPTNNPAVCAAVEGALFPRIVDKPTTRVGVLARKAVAAADPVAAADKAERAREGRFVFAGPSGLPGLMRFEAELESGKGRLVWAAIEELAADYVKQGVVATMDQARADALVDLVLAKVEIRTVVDLALPAGFASGHPERAGSCACRRDSVLEDRATGVLVDADQGGADVSHEPGSDRSPNRDNYNKYKDKHTFSTYYYAGGAHAIKKRPPKRPLLLLKRDGRARKRDVDREVGHDNVLRLLTGLPTAGVLDHRVGTLSSATIQAILADPDTVFRRLVVDPDTGWLMDAGATSYHPGRHLARMVRKRDLTCRFPGCGTAARFCDLDHVIPFPVGLTVLRNLACLCRRHHRLKTHGHWSLSMTPEGVCTWEDRRTGQIHTTEPADYRDLAV